MKKIADMSPEVLIGLQARERRRLVELTSLTKAAQIEMLLETRQFDALKPAFAAIDTPRRRLQATAHACRIAALPGTIMDAKLGTIAADSLWAYQKELTPLGERLAVVLCINILKDNDRLPAPPVEKAIAESLIARMGADRTTDPMNMTRTMKALTRQLLREYFAARTGGFEGRDYLKQLALHSRDTSEPVRPAINVGGASTVTFVDFRKPR